MTPTLRGISPKTTLHLIARHEAAHLVMLWLMDRPVLGCMVSAEGGVTVQLPDEAGTKETQNEHILYALAGMIGEKNLEVREELREHVGELDYFDPNTDSYHVVQAISLLKGNPNAWLACYELAVGKLLEKFAKPHQEAAALLATKGMLHFKEIYEMFTRWDEAFFPDGKVKSDICARTVLRQLGMRLPRQGFFGWDLRPVPKGWQQPKPPSFPEIMRMVGKHLLAKKAKEDRIPSKGGAQDD